MGGEGIPNAQSKKVEPIKLTPGMWTTSDPNPHNRHHIIKNTHADFERLLETR